MEDAPLRVEGGTSLLTACPFFLLHVWHPPSQFPSAWITFFRAERLRPKPFSSLTFFPEGPLFPFLFFFFFFTFPLLTYPLFFMVLLLMDTSVGCFFFFFSGVFTFFLSLFPHQYVSTTCPFLFKSFFSKIPFDTPSRLSTCWLGFFFFAADFLEELRFFSNLTWSPEYTTFPLLGFFFSQLGVGSFYLDGKLRWSLFFFSPRHLFWAFSPACVNIRCEYEFFLVRISPLFSSFKADIPFFHDDFFFFSVFPSPPFFI